MRLFSQLFTIKPPLKPNYNGIYTSPNYRVEKMGECDQGSYIEMYIPENPYKNKGALVAVIYLHGFTLGASEIYRSHLEHLVKQGYYVLYPNFQRGFCEFSPCRFENLYELVIETLSPFPVSPVAWMESAINSTIKAYEHQGACNLDIVFTSTREKRNLYVSEPDNYYCNCHDETNLKELLSSGQVGIVVRIRDAKNFHGSWRFACSHNWIPEKRKWDIC